MRLQTAIVGIAATFAFGITGCDDGTSVGNLVPMMAINPNPLDLGNVQVGTTVTRRLEVKNDGTGTLSIASVDPVALDESITFSVPSDFRVQAKAVGYIDVTFSPLELGEVGGTLKVTSSDNGVDPIDVVLKGTGVTAQIAVDPELVNFGNVIIQTTKTLPVAITNNSDTEADIGLNLGDNSKFPGSTDSAVYTVSPTTKPLNAQGRFKLAPGESTSINVSFSPTIAGTRERGDFRLKACDLCPEQEIKLDGVGIENGFKCDPAALNFGQVNPQSCVTRSVTCENIANDPVTIVGWAGGQATSADFSFETFTQAQLLEEGDTITVDVTYCPNDLGNDVGTLSIETDRSNPRLQFVSVLLAGTGGGPDIDVQPLVVNFGEVSLIAPSRRSIQVQNVGFSTLTVSEVVADTANTGAFSASAAGFDVVAGDFYDITVEFQPTAEGPVESELVIKSNDQDEPEVRVVVQGIGVNLPPCNFEVVPGQLNFGVVERNRRLSRAFEIRNRGTQDCLLTSARMVPGSDTEFSLPDGDVLSERVAPSSSRTIRVEYSPEDAATHSGGVEFSISSPTSPFNEVPLSGTGADATLLIVPRDMDFGVVGVGCAARDRLVQIYNTGSTPALINSIAMSNPPSPAFTLQALPAGLPGSPVTLQPGGSTSFEIGFHADAAASYAGAVEISADFAGQTVTYVVAMQGRGDIDARSTDNFEQLPEAKVDILFVIDDSCSMGEEQDALSANFDAFIRFAEAQSIDYQLGVTTTDTDGFSDSPDGRLVPISGPAANRIVTPFTQPSPESVFAQNVAVGINGSASERGLQGAYLALSAPHIFGHNAGLLRQDAVLSIIFVSDEPDQSNNTVDFYINFFLSIKGFRNSNLFSASAIVGDDPGGCNGGGGSASAGPRYIEVANRTGGIFQSICVSDWSRSLEDLSTSAFGFKSRFFLQNQPVITSITVTVDGAEVPGTSPQGTVNWTYDFATNSINFTPFATPEPGAEIEVEYSVECL